MLTQDEPLRKELRIISRHAFTFHCPRSLIAWRTLKNRVLIYVAYSCSSALLVCDPPFPLGETMHWSSAV